MIIIRVSTRGIKKSIRHLKKVKLSDRNISSILIDAGEKSKVEWEKISKKYYNKRIKLGLPVTGQWSKSLDYIKLSKKSIGLFHKPIYSQRGIKAAKPSARGREFRIRLPGLRLTIGFRLPRIRKTKLQVKVYEYSQYLKRNVGQSKGRYVLKLDARIKEGVHKGIKNKPRYTSATKDLVRFINRRVRKNLKKLIRRKVRGKGI